MTSSDPAHEPSTDDPTPAGEPVRWGFLATGKIARSVAADLALVPSARLVAVGARRLGLFLYVSDARAGNHGIVERPGVHRDDARAAVQQDLGPASGRGAEVQCPLASEVFNPG